MCFGFMIVNGTLLGVALCQLERESAVIRMGDIKFDSRQDQEIFSSPKFHFSSVTHPATHLEGNGAILSCVKWQERPADHLAKSSDNIRNECICTSAASTCLHGMHMDNITFTFTV
jgi:hypothetical protein